MSNLNEWGDLLCGDCIAIMIAMSKELGLSYGLINVLLFVILGPISAIVFGLSSIIAKTKGKYARRISISLDIIGILIVLVVLGLIVFGFLAWSVDPELHHML